MTDVKKDATENQPMPSESAETSRFAAQAENERRSGDRRQAAATPNADGHIVTPNYSGPDRRTGLDRRAYMERQRQIIREEQSRFIQRSVITGAVFFILIVLAGMFLLAPEYVQLQRRADQIEKQKAEQAALPAAAPAPAAPSVPLGYAMNRQIARADAAVDALSATTQSMIARAGDAGAVAAETALQLAEGDTSGLRALVEFIGHTHTLASTPAGRTQLQTSLQGLKAALGDWQGDAAGFNRAITEARQRDAKLNGMLGSVAPQDVGAAAMLLLMGEFRTNVAAGRPFEQDLAVVQKLAGNNPNLQASLARLAPYAKTGVLSPATLQTEFKGLAMDIVTAKAAGQEVGVADAAKARLQNLVKIRDAKTVEGATADAVVNRAQALLNQGDINGAVRELQALQGAPAAAAAPFINQAQGAMVADQTADAVIANVLSQLAAGGGVSAEGLQGLIGNSLGFGGMDGPVSPVSGQ